LNETIPFNDKNTFQVYIGDYDILGTQYYEGRWLTKYSEVKEEMKRKNEYPIYVTIGEQFTSVLSNKDKLYTFTGKDVSGGQKIDLGGAADYMSVCDKAAYLVKQDGKMYVWGSNALCFISSKEDVNV
jgi:hypothetical protein